MATYECKECGGRMKCIKTEKVLDVDDRAHTRASVGSMKLRTGGHPTMATIATVANLGTKAVNYLFKKRTLECTKCGRIVETTTGR